MSIIRRLDRPEGGKARQATVEVQSVDDELGQPFVGRQDRDSADIDDGVDGCKLEMDASPRRVVSCQGRGQDAAFERQETGWMVCLLKQNMQPNLM